jgi:hypothetical protein
MLRVGDRQAAEAATDGHDSHAQFRGRQNAMMATSTPTAISCRLTSA